MGGDARRIVEEWVAYLRDEKLWGLDDPPFPATKVERGETAKFEVTGLTREMWRSADSIRRIFRQAFERAGLEYYVPHSLRKTLTRLGQELCRTPEEFKAWSQNLGHEHVMTTLYNYGEVAPERQAEIIAAIGHEDTRRDSAADEFSEAVVRKMQEREPSSSVIYPSAPLTKRGKRK